MVRGTQHRGRARSNHCRRGASGHGDLFAVLVVGEMSDLEESFATQLKQHSLPEPTREFPFALMRRRKFRFDFAWIEERVAVEIQGATFRKGAHSSGTGLARDFEKNNLAMLLGWKVFYFDSKMVQDGRAVNTICEAFGNVGMMEMAW